MTTLLHLNTVGRRFGGLTALHDLSLSIAAGTRHAVIGPNGAGKTTLLNLIAGTLRPTHGNITLAGRDITRLPAPARARRGISRTWQHPAVFTRLTVEANLTLASTHRRHPAARTALLRSTQPAGATQVTRLVDHAGLTAHAQTPAGQLPYGTQRRLELAMALATQPRLLLLDEPSAGLDPTEIAHLTQLLNRLADDVTVLLVDHNLDLIWPLAHTVTVLHHGRHLTTGNPQQVRTNPQVQTAYLPTTGQPAPAHPRRCPQGRPLLRVRDLRAGYHGAPVLDGVTLTVDEGEAVAVLGRNGAGKTTLLNTIAGLPPTHTGHIQLADQPLNRSRPHQAARAGLAFVPQTRRLFTPLTVLEHLTCAHTAHPAASRSTTGRSWTTKRILDLLPALAARTHHPAHQLSGGEQQMLALARALATNPRLLLLDEPTEGLAPTLITQLTDVLATLVADGLALLLAEQNLTLATAVTHRILVLHTGHVAMTCRTPDFTAATHQHRLHTLLGITDTPTTEMTP